MGGTHNDNKSPLVSLIAGGTAGAIEISATYPFEFAKTRVQLKDDGVPRNPLVVIRKVVQRDGVRALYKGIGPMVAGTVLKDALRFVSFDLIRAQFQDPITKTLSPINNLLAGITAGIIASTFAVTPSERIKTALIDDARHARRFRSTLHATRELIAQDGLIRGLYRGYISTTLKQSTSTAVRLGTYNILKDFQRGQKIEQTTATTFFNGSVAGTTVVFGTQPFDVLKTRTQSVKGEGLKDAFTSIWNERGLVGFWRGSTMRLGRTVVAGGILFTSYEWVATLVTPLVTKVEETVKNEGGGGVVV